MVRLQVNNGEKDIVHYQIFLPYKRLLFYLFASHPLYRFCSKNGLSFYVDLSEGKSLYIDKNSTQKKNIWNYFFVQQALPNDEMDYCYASGKYEGDTSKIWLRSHFKTVNQHAVQRLKYTPAVADALSKAKKAFPTKTLGVHIRRTDHHTEVPLVPLEHFVAAIKSKLQQGIYTNLFIATDDATVITFIKKRLPEINILVNDVMRSVNGEPVHKSENKNGFELGVEALLDAHCLSYCDEAILSHSSLSYCVLYLNPALKYTLLDGFRYHHQNKYVPQLVNLSKNMHYLFFHNLMLTNMYRKFKYFKSKFSVTSINR